jgi:sterol desaturase/sphingolipid hydroxylase (fatty acid hydroxylase superfamily)
VFSCIGFDPNVFGSCLNLILVLQFLVHSEKRYTFGFLGKLFNSPAVHSIHHSCLPQHQNCNYAGLLLIWDYLFKTFHYDEVNLKYGVSTSRTNLNALQIQTEPFIKI